MFVQSLAPSGLFPFPRRGITGSEQLNRVLWVIEANVLSREAEPASASTASGPRQGGSQDTVASTGCPTKPKPCQQHGGNWVSHFFSCLICMSLLTMRLDIFQTHTGASGFLFLIILFLPLPLGSLVFPTKPYENDWN